MDHIIFSHAKLTFSLLCMTLVLFLTGCRSPHTLQSGLWSGHMTPMNHPEMKTELTFEVSYDKRIASITLNGHGGMHLPTRNLNIQKNMIEFTFNEPEQNVALSCQFIGSDQKGFSGRCTDDSGKWAVFEMIPPR